MTTAEFAEAGERLYGPEWRRPLAEALDIAPVTVWRYANGLSLIPHTVELALIALAIEQVLAR